MEESETIRKWFANLPSGAARSSAAAIYDDKFIESYLKHSKRYKETVLRSHHFSENGDAIINSIISGK